MENFECKPNSDKARYSKEEPTSPAPVEKIVIEGVKEKPKSLLQRTIQAAIGQRLPEGTKDLKTYIISDLLAPKIVDGLHDTLIAVIEGIFGNNANAVSYNKGSIPRVSYIDYTNIKKSGSNEPLQRKYDDTLNCDFTFNNCGDANRVLAYLQDIINTHRCATVANLYDVIQVRNKNWQATNSYGWNDLREAEVVRIKENGVYRWLLKLPQPLPIDNE